MIRTVGFLLLLWTSALAWVMPPSPTPPSPTPPSAKTIASRREILASAGTAALATSLLGSKPALALSQEEIDKANIVKGYKRLVYLLDNWDKETTVCKIGQTTTFGDNCERTPLKVMDYLGYKSTNDPLFKVEKTLKRLGALVPAERDVDYLDAVENLLQNAEEASGMAYVSSWGEANPGGGKDRVELFIERAKKNVIVSKESLATVIEILGLKM